MKVRFDIIFAVAFLTSRVRCPTNQDQQKLQRIIQYLNLSKDQKFKIKKSNSLDITNSIDASFASHSDGKSHSGSVLSVGTTPVMIKSVKQKSITKDSTEAEITALQNLYQHSIDMREFLTDLGFDIAVPTIFQDNQSAMFLVSEGKPIRNKYLLVKQEVIKDRLRRGDIQIDYCPTEEMMADGLTKPLQGRSFRNSVGLLLGSECTEEVRCARQ
jgi:hypothetical protein